jgi:hypothetical protein
MTEHYTEYPPSLTTKSASAAQILKQSKLSNGLQVPRKDGHLTPCRKPQGAAGSLGLLSAKSHKGFHGAPERGLLAGLYAYRFVEEENTPRAY